MNYEYPNVVYKDTLEDMDRIIEEWKTLHGVDIQFCIDFLHQYANNLERIEET